MDYIIGGLIVGVIIFIFISKKKTDEYNRMTLIDFPIWLSIYLESAKDEKHLMARAFVIQTIDLAPVYGSISVEHAKFLKSKTFKENPIDIVNNWIYTGLPYVENHYGLKELEDAQARLVGVFMFTALQSTNPEESLRLFTEKFQSR